MSEPSRPPQEIIDWGLAAFAVALGAALMGLSSNSAPPADRSAVSVLQVRLMEQELKVLDAVTLIPPEMRTPLGVDPEDKANNLERAMGHLESHLQSKGRDDAVDYILVSTLATAHSQDKIALQALDEAARDGQLETWAGFAGCLGDLAGGFVCRNRDQLDAVV